MATWSHGYVIEIPYTYGFYRETSPLWIKYACLLAGKKPPSEKRLRIIELGCGQGFNLCLLASAFPKYEFVGLDINPSHIAHAKELASAGGLKNITFYEADFVEYAKDYPKELGQFHIAILHGIWSWIGKFVRMSAIELLKKALVPGGIVYNSYNAMPGWMQGSILREILRSYYKLSGISVLEAIEGGLKIAQELLEANAFVFQAYPGLKNKLEQAKKQDRHYLVHEYLSEYHSIYWVHEVVEEMQEGKLYYIGTLNLVENYIHILMSETMRNLISKQPHPIYRLFLTDLLINQSFRRDLYQKGILNITSQETLMELGNFKLIRAEDPKLKEDEEFKFKTCMGEVIGKREIYSAILEALPCGVPKSITEISNYPKIKELKLAFSGLIQALTFLLDANMIFPYNEDADPAYSFKFNRAITNMSYEGKTYNFLSSPKTGLALFLNNLEIWILNTIFKGIRDSEKIKQALTENLKRLNQKVIRDGKVVESEEETAKIVEENIRDFLTKRIPILRVHGILQ